MPDTSLLSDEIRALIGSSYPLEPARVTARAVRRAAEVYLGAPAANLRLEPGQPVPGYAIAGIDAESEAERPEIPRLLPNSILISNDWQFERPLRLDETLQRTYVVTNISERFGGRFGYSIDIRTEIQFRDPNGKVVARTGSTMMQYDASEARPDDTP